MRTSGSLSTSPGEIGQEARMLEKAGADIGSAPDLSHDPLVQLALAASSTSKMQLMTSIAVAFARSPMTLAQSAHDVNSLSEGRFILGLGSQIKPHIEKRYSMPWSKPAARMREYVLALKAIWACWYEGRPLNFQGEFYTHTLMTPMFTPADSRFGAPPVYVAGVGPLMTRNAAEVADGVMLHSFTTEEYIRSVTMPAVEEGLAIAGKSRDAIDIVGSPFIITGQTEEEFEQVKQSVCKQLAFYGSTPAYRPVLESVGYGDLQSELHGLSKAGEWIQMGSCIDDNLLQILAVVGEPNDIASQIEERFGDLFDICAINVFGGDNYSIVGYDALIGDALKG